MNPSYSTKNNVRYRFYVSSALLRGRKTEAGSVSRVAAAEIESAVLAALERRQGSRDAKTEPTPAAAIERVVIAADQALITLAVTDGSDDRTVEIPVPWSIKPRDSAPTIEGDTVSGTNLNESLVQAIVRAACLGGIAAKRGLSVRRDARGG